MSKPTAAPNRWPYWEHRTLAEVQGIVAAPLRRVKAVAPLYVPPPRLCAGSRKISLNTAVSSMEQRAESWKRA